MVMASLFNDQQNPVQQLQVKFKEVETGFNTWLSKQSLAVEVAVVSTMSGVQGAFIGGLMGTLSHDMPQTGVDPQAIKQAQALVGGPWVQARNFGVNAGIACLMKRIRGKDDLESLRRFCSNIGMSQQAVKAAQEAVLKYDEFDIRRSPISIAAVVIYIITQLSDD